MALSKDDRRKVSIPFKSRLHSTRKAFQGQFHYRPITLPQLPPIEELEAPINVKKAEKRSSVSRKQLRQSGSGLLRKFDVALEANRDEIVHWVDKNLEQTESELIKQLEQIAESFHSSLKIATHLEAQVHESIANEEIYIGKLKDPVLLSERMRDFEQLVNNEKRALEDLWQQWTETQVDMVCLAFEVLGPASFDITKHQISAPVGGKLESSSKSHDIVAARYVAALEHGDIFESAMKDITKRTVHTAEAQQKEWKLDQRRCLKAIETAVENYFDAA